VYIPKVEFEYINGSKIPPKKIIILSGAGISQPSGIKTFRDTNGLWENYNIDEICNEYTWKKNFELVHEFYNQRRVQLKEVQPNEAHKTIARIVKKYGKENVFNITQNVDDLFERAGIEALHVHGELTKMECTACGNIWDIGYRKFDIKKDRCPKCNSLKGVKPKIVFFNGQAPMYSYMFRAFDYAMNPDSIVIIVGTMGNVIPINHMIMNTPCKCFLNNMESSEHLDEKLFDEIFYESCITAMPKIEQKIDELW